MSDILNVFLKKLFSVQGNTVLEEVIYFRLESVRKAEN